MNEQVKPEAEEAEISEYFERVLPSLPSFLPTLAVFPTVLLALYPISPIIGFVAGGVLGVLAPLLMITKAPTIRIANGYLETAKARLPISVIKSVELIPKESSFSERGPKLNSRAFFVFQASVPELVKIELADPQDPTPYWLLSTRRGIEIERLVRELSGSESF